MIRSPDRVGYVLFVALWAFIALSATGPVFAESLSSLPAASAPAPEKSGLGPSARPAVVRPDTAAKAQTAGSFAKASATANPLWFVPLSVLTATRERPLFSPSRRPPPPPVVKASTPAPPPPPPPPPPPDHPNLTLVGTVLGEGDSIAVFIDTTSQEVVRLHTREGHQGWIVRAIDQRGAALQKGDRVEMLEFTTPGAPPLQSTPQAGTPAARAPAAAAPAPPPPLPAPASPQRPPPGQMPVLGAASPAPSAPSSAPPAPRRGRTPAP